MNRRFFTFFIIFAFTMVSLPSPTYAATVTWDLNTTGDYTVSDSLKIDLDGSVAQLIETDLNHVFALNDNGTVELSGASAVDIVGDYAYVTAYLDDGVEIFDISDPTSPVSVGRITDNGTTELDGAWDIEVVGNYAYIVSFLDDGLEILDISDPTNPTHVGAITDNATTRLNGAAAIKVVGNYAYIASYVDNGFQVIDISNPAAPTHVAAIGDDGTTELAGAYGIDVVGNYAYVAAYTDDGVEIIDISNPAAPAHVGAITDDATTELNGARGIVVVGNYAYVAGLDDSGFEVLDISNPAAPTHVAKIADNGTTELSGASEIVINGNYAFVTAYFDDGVEMIDISDPTNPVHVGAITNGPGISLNGAVGIDTINGEYLFVASRDNSGVEMLRVGYYDDSPYLSPNSGQVFSQNLTGFEETLGAGNAGSVSHQISNDDGTTWYYWDGGAWATTTATDGTETSSAANIDTNISTFDTDGGTFLWRAYLESDGTEEVILDEVTLTIADPSVARSGGRRVYGCKDEKAINYTSFASHKQSLCKYENSQTDTGNPEMLGNGELCAANMILSQNLTAPSRDGQYGTYTKATVTEAKILQAHMNRLGFESGPEDGIIGPITLGAIKRMQTFLGTIPDGLVGPITRGLINNSC